MTAKSDLTLATSKEHPIISLFLDADLRAHAAWQGRPPRMSAFEHSCGDRERPQRADSVEKLAIERQAEKGRFYVAIAVASSIALC